MNPKFTEKQRFTQWWFWAILLAIGSIFIYGIYKQVILGTTFGDKPMSNVGLLISTLAYLILTLFFLSLKLVTKIDERGIRYYFFPFIKKEVKWTEIKKAEVLTYDFVGWGIRLSSKYGNVYNIKGNKGLAIELINGEKILIGTQKQEEIKGHIKTS